MARMTGFIFQDEYLERLAKLSDQEVGRLIRALATYHATGEEQELAGREGIAYDFIKVDIDRIDRKYEARGETNRLNRAGSTTIVNDRQRSSTDGDEAEETATKPHKDKVKVKDKEKENDKDIPAKRERAQAQLEMFNRFWERYPRKTAKQAAVKAWGKIKPDEALLNTILAALEKQIQAWDDPQFIPHPATWLNGRRWEDEPVQRKKVAQTQYKQREYEDRKPTEMPEWLKEEMEMGNSH